MNLVIRADASPQIGAGHVMRCIALGQAWQDLGGQVTFASSQMLDSMQSRLSVEGFHSKAVNSTPGSREDARTVVEIAKLVQAKAIVIDGYHFNEDYLADISHPEAIKLVLDDSAHLRHYETDVLLNQNCGATPGLYQGLTNREKSQLLLGTQFALLRREFRRQVSSNQNISCEKAAKNILVTMGAADPDNALSCVVEALKQSSRPDLHFTVITGSLNENHAAIEKATLEDERFYVIRHVNYISELYTSTDFAICAGGSTNWEMCRYGIPRIIIELAENQKLVCEQLSALGIAKHGGNSKQLKPSELLAVFDAAIIDRDFLENATQTAKELIDGNGALRVARFLNRPRLEAPAIQLRPAEMNDWELLLAWRNDPHTRKASRNSSVVSEANHKRWLETYLSTPRNRLMIAECEGTPVGTVRIDAGEPSEISWTIAPNQRGKGLGTRMVKLAVVDAELPIKAVARKDNISSQRIAESAGLKKFSSNADWVEYMLEPKTK